MMYVVWGLVGAVLGFALQQEFFATVFGAMLGIGWARMSGLRRDLNLTRKELAQARQAFGAAPRAGDAPPRPVASYGSPDTGTAPVPDGVGVPVGAGDAVPPPLLPAGVSDLRPTVTDAGWTEGTAPGVSPPVPPGPPPMPPRDTVAPAQPPVPPRPTWIDAVVTRVRTWFTEGNVPVKIGMLVLFAGVAALLKYASDAGMFHLPVSVRVALVALAAIVALAFGWRQRFRRRAFALSLQGGAIGVLTIDVFAAFRLYELLPPTAAFGMLVVLVAGAGVLAVLQDSLALAVLGLVAGFAAPILTSTGHGSHVALFSYYALLNLGVLAIAWKRAWRVLNLLGFVATFGVGAAWGVLQYKPEQFASTEPFLLLNFFFYLVIPWLYLRRAAQTRERVLDACLLFGNPLVSLLLQGALLRWQGKAMAVSALVAAVVYLGVAYSVRKQRDLGVLRDAWAVLAIGFATLAVPLALSASVTAGIFAVEGAGLVWLGWRQQRWFARWSGLGLQGIAAFAWAAGHVPSWQVPAVAHRNYLGALLIAVGGAASTWLYHRYGSEKPRSRMAAVVLFGWTMAWWLLPTTVEIAHHLTDAHAAAGILALVGITAWVVAELARGAVHGLGTAMRLVVAGLTWASILVIALCLVPSWQVLGGWLLLAVVATFASGWRAVACLRGHPRLAAATQLGWWWRVPVTIACALVVAMDGWHWLDDSWRLLMVVAPALVLWFIALSRPAWVQRPLQKEDSAVDLLLHSLFVMLGVIFLCSLFAEG
ncbi:DUF2339 domain-containing protein, partial [Pinirhizobacter sp.]|uniref:DUF2339 domain-containing protein n=1 Tax=Pinirhizobacter sp. TaxID=2950432 RepID=UPI002F4137B0